MAETRHCEHHHRENTHELVVLVANPQKSQDSTECNYTQLKTIRNPVNVYEKPALSQNEECKDELKGKEYAVIDTEKSTKYKKKAKATRKIRLAYALCVAVLFLTALIISALVVSSIGFLHADSTASKERGLREMIRHMAQQVDVLQADVGRLQTRLNATIDHLDTIVTQQALDTQREIDDSIARLQQLFQSELTQQNNNLQMVKTDLTSNINDLFNTTANLTGLRSTLDAHINTYESSTTEFNERDDSLQQNIDSVNDEVNAQLTSTRNDLEQLSVRVNMLSTM